MIKLQDFARDRGVTDRQVHRLLNKYASALEGLYERRGQNGTWLTDDACDFLRGKMKAAPVVVADEDPRVAQYAARIAELEKRLDEKDKVLMVAQKTVSEAQERVSELQSEVNKVKALEEGKRALEAENEALKAKCDKMANATLWQRLKGFKE